MRLNEYSNNFVVEIPGFYLLRHNRKARQGGGVSMYLRQTLIGRILQSLSEAGPDFIISPSPEFIIVDITTLNTSKIMYCVLYRP